MRTLVTGGSGFIGSAVVDRLAGHGHQVTVVDDLSTGRRENLADALASGRVELAEVDLAGPELAKTSRRQPAARAALASAMVPSTLTRASCSGSLTLWRTSIWAARW